ncbi:MAG TPA: Uma2 family endonuclease [Gammaproteobacteria bacterium]|nr:Uma2 family endonuclease [Gammaproteobacteria bacterium]
MSRPARRKASYEDLLALPEHQVGEIIAGELHAHPRPAPRHARAYSALTGTLWNPYDSGNGGPGGWWILDEPELHLGEDVLVPDLAGWRRERLPRLPETPWFELAPDWVCEILSPSTARVDRVLKMPVYAREGVGHLWLVDPDLQTLEVYRLDTTQDSPHWLLLESLEGNAPVRQPPFDAIEFPLGSLWAEPPAGEAPDADAEPDR